MDRARALVSNCQSRAYNANNADDDYYGGGDDSDMDLNYDKMVKAIKDMESENRIPEFQNFLKHAALIIANKKLNESGVFSANIRLSGYSQLHILVVDKESVAFK